MSKNARISFLFTCLWLVLSVSVPQPLSWVLLWFSGWHAGIATACCIFESVTETERNA